MSRAGSWRALAVQRARSSLGALVTARAAPLDGLGVAHAGGRGDDAAAAAPAERADARALPRRSSRASTSAATFCNSAPRRRRRSRSSRCSVNAMAGYAFAKLRFRGRDRLFRAAARGAGRSRRRSAMLPLFLMLRALGLVNTYWRRRSSPGSPAIFGIFLIRQYALVDPRRAARRGAHRRRERVPHLLVDRAAAAARRSSSRWRVFTFLGAWNDFMWPLIVLTDETQLHAAGGAREPRRRARAGHRADDGRRGAHGAARSSLLFLALQRYYIAGHHGREREGVRRLATIAAASPSPSRRRCASRRARPAVDDFEDARLDARRRADGVELELARRAGRRPALRLDFDFARPRRLGRRRAARSAARPAGELRASPSTLRGEALAQQPRVQARRSTSGENVWWVNRRDFELPRELARRSASRAARSPSPGDRAAAARSQDVDAVEIAITAGEGGRGTVVDRRARARASCRRRPTDRRQTPPRRAIAASGTTATALVVDFGERARVRRPRSLRWALDAAPRALRGRVVGRRRRLASCAVERGERRRGLALPARERGARTCGSRSTRSHGAAAVALRGDRSRCRSRAGASPNAFFERVAAKAPRGRLSARLHRRADATGRWSASTATPRRRCSARTARSRSARAAPRSSRSSGSTARWSRWSDVETRAALARRRPADPDRRLASARRASSRSPPSPTGRSAVAVPRRALRGPPRPAGRVRAQGRAVARRCGRSRSTRRTQFLNAPGGVGADLDRVAGTAAGLRWSAGRTGRRDRVGTARRRASAPRPSTEAASSSSFARGDLAAGGERRRSAPAGPRRRCAGTSSSPPARSSEVVCDRHPGRRRGAADGSSAASSGGAEAWRARLDGVELAPAGRPRVAREPARRDAGLAS